MPYAGERLKVCPDCSKRGVSLRQRPNGEDHYGCRYCDWFAYSYKPMQIDLENLEKLKAANPEKPKDME